MEEPHSKPTLPPDSPVVPFLDSWGRPQIQIERQRRYRATSEGPVFDRAEDTQAFNEKIDTIARLQDQLNASNRKAEEALRQLPAAR